MTWYSSVSPQRAHSHRHYLEDKKNPKINVFFTWELVCSIPTAVNYKTLRGKKKNSAYQGTKFLQQIAYMTNFRKILLLPGRNKLCPRMGICKGVVLAANVTYTSSLFIKQCALQNESMLEHLVHSVSIFHYQCLKICRRYNLLSGIIPKPAQ